MSAPDEAFPKSVRLRKRREYLAVQRGGRRVNTPNFIVYGRSNRGLGARLGVTVSKKVGNAAIRNRVKRLLREAFRRHRDRLPEDVDLVFVARRGQSPVSYEEVVAEMLSAGGRVRHGQRPSRRGRRR